MRRVWRVDIDHEPTPVVDEWRLIIEACPWPEAIDLDGDGQPDRFVYVIEVAAPPVESPVAGTLRATLPESRVVGPWRDLVDRVRQAAARDT
jgi:hypothetical protein